MFDSTPQLAGWVGEEDGFDPLKLSTYFDMARSLPLHPLPAPPRAAAAREPGDVACRVAAVALNRPVREIGTNGGHGRLGGAAPAGS